MESTGIRCWKVEKGERGGEIPPRSCAKLCVEGVSREKGDLLTMYVDENHEEHSVGDVYGKVWEPQAVKRARLEKSAYFKNMNVYDICRSEECYQETGERTDQGKVGGHEQNERPREPKHQIRTGRTRIESE